MWPFHWMKHQKRGLRMWVLTLLSNGPRNGVEVMNEIESMTRGWWRPSPGSVYPLLDQLAEEGLVAKQADGRYALTPAAHDQGVVPFGLGFRPPRTVDGTITELAAYVSYLEELARDRGDEVGRQAKRLADISSRLSKLARPPVG